MYYDAPGRLVRTEMPDGTFSRVEFSPWFSRSFDPNDTVLEPGNRWYAEHTAAAAEDGGQARCAASRRTTPSTPAEMHFDSLGREVIAIAHNRTPADDAGYSNTSLTEPALARRALPHVHQARRRRQAAVDPRRARQPGDAVHHAAAGPITRRSTTRRPDDRPAYCMPPSALPCYDIAGNLLFQHSMDAGDRWMLMDAAGQAAAGVGLQRAQGRDDARLFKEHRRIRVTTTPAPPLERWFACATRTPARRTNFSSSASATERAREREAAQPTRQGLAATTTAAASCRPTRSISRSSHRSRRRLASDIEAPVVDWNGRRSWTTSHCGPLRASKTKSSPSAPSTTPSAASTRHYNWHVESPGNSGQSDRVAVYLPGYNRAAARRGDPPRPRAARRAAATSSPRNHAQPGRDQGHRLQRQGPEARLDCGNGTVTRYDYDPRPSAYECCAPRARATTRAFPRSAVSSQTQESCSTVLRLRPVGQHHPHPGRLGTSVLPQPAVEAASRYVYDAMDRFIEATGRENGRGSGAPAHPGGPLSVALSGRHPRRATQLQGALPLRPGRKHR